MSANSLTESDRYPEVAQCHGICQKHLAQQDGRALKRFGEPCGQSLVARLAKKTFDSNGIVVSTMR